MRNANTGMVPMEQKLYWAKVFVVVANEPKLYACVCAHACMLFRVITVFPPFIFNDQLCLTWNTKSMLNKTHKLDTNCIFLK